MIVRLAIRGFAAGKVQFEDRVEVESADLADVLPGLAEKHGQALAEHRLHMIEIEFLDEPDKNARFFRLGTDPSMMVIPIEVNLLPPE